jgi:YebC/PmpR family DNA-binding regulatory protein
VFAIGNGPVSVFKFPCVGAQWKQAGREANAQKRGQLVSKLVRELVVAAKVGGGDPELNARLAAAMEKARKASVPRETIERAVKKGAGGAGGAVNYETVIFEGFGPHKVPLIVECLTDNRNRTVPEIRHLFRAGTLGNPGSVAFFFDHLGVVEATHADSGRDPEGDAIEAGAQEVEALEAAEVPEGHIGARFLTELKELGPVSKWLAEAGWRIIASEPRFEAKSPVQLGDAERREVVDFLNALDDHDDVHRVYAALR